MKKNGLSVMGKIAIVASFFLVGLAGNVSAQETGFVEMSVEQYAVVSEVLTFDGATTIELWRRGAPATAHALASNKSAEGGFMFRFEGGDRQTPIEYGPNATYTTTQRKSWLNPQVSAATDLWYHHALVITERGYIQLYTNGALVAQVTTVPNDGEFDYTNGAQALWIGDAGWSKGSGTTHAFADVRVWSCARTATEIAENYQSRVAANASNLFINYLFTEQTGDEVANQVNPTGTKGIMTNDPIVQWENKNAAYDGRTHSWGIIGAIPTGLSSSEEEGTTSTTLSWTAGDDNKWEVEITSNGETWTLMETSVPTFDLNGISATNCRARVRTSWPLVSAWSSEFVINGINTGLVDSKTYNTSVSYQNGAVSLRNLEGSNDILVYNAAGALQHQFKSAESAYTIDASSWASGVYVIKVKNETKSKTMKIVL